MANLIRRRDTDLPSLVEPFDRMVHELLRPMTLWAPEVPMAWSVPIDVYEDGDDVVVKANVAGIDPEALHVEMADDEFRLWGTFEHAEEREREHFHVRERRTGRFERAGTLPSAIDRDSVTAEVTKGVLTVRAHKAPNGRRREVKVSVKD
ncbi:MAG: Hsp20/alpha crystallin family protein [Trueperaceae bacterium]|nr:Hsp20/alpha crystallin family protein [Trueperaceae bacterium]